MADYNYSQKSYFELSKHSATQIFIFTILLLGSIVMVFVLLLPLLHEFFEKFLSSEVHNDGSQIPYLLETKGNLKSTNYLFLWAVDVYKDTPQEARYWFNPLLSLVSFVFIMSSLFAFSISSLLPIKFGLMRQKIEREIANLISTITVNYFGSSEEYEQREIIEMIKNADMHQMYENHEEWDMPLEDLIVLQRAIIWKQSGMMYQFFHLNDGISMYMKFYFTVKYSNAVLGFVYIGAAVLIIVVGLRGLKFIPPTQPSIVLFSLGLEFTLLVVYAFSLIYTKQDEENEKLHKSHSGSSDNVFLGSDFGSSREIEKLLRVFIKSSPKKRIEKDDKD